MNPHAEMEVGDGRVPSTPDQGPWIAVADRVAFAYQERFVPEVHEDDEVARGEPDDDHDSPIASAGSVKRLATSGVGSVRL